MMFSFGLNNKYYDILRFVNYKFLWYYRHTKKTRNYQFFKKFDNNVLFGIYYSGNQVVLITNYLIVCTKLIFDVEV